MGLFVLSVDQHAFNLWFGYKERNVNMDIELEALKDALLVDR